MGCNVIDQPSVHPLTVVFLTVVLPALLTPDIDTKRKTNGRLWIWLTA